MRTRIHVLVGVVMVSLLGAVAASSVLPLVAGVPRSAQLSGQDSMPLVVLGAWTSSYVGVNKTSFQPGEIVVINAEIAWNQTLYYGGEQPYLALVVVVGPNGQLAHLGLSKGVLPFGETLHVATGFPAPSLPGTYEVTIIVWDTWLSEGGKPVAEPLTLTFTVG